jgi:hypothetical protein
MKRMLSALTESENEGMLSSPSSGVLEIPVQVVSKQADAPLSPSRPNSLFGLFDLERPPTSERRAMDDSVVSLRSEAPSVEFTHSRDVLLGVDLRDDVMYHTVHGTQGLGMAAALNEERERLRKAALKRANVNLTRLERQRVNMRHSIYSIQSSNSGPRQRTGTSHSEDIGSMDSVERRMTSSTLDVLDTDGAEHTEEIQEEEYSNSLCQIRGKGKFFVCR